MKKKAAKKPAAKSSKKPKAAAKPAARKPAKSAAARKPPARAAAPEPRPVPYEPKPIQGIGWQPFRYTP